MLDGHFARLDADNNGLINRDEYAGRHINLFLTIDADSRTRCCLRQRSGNFFMKEQQPVAT